jgi:nitrile hydratase accessory protein
MTSDQLFAPLPAPIITTSDVGLADFCADTTVTPLLRDEGRPVFNDSWEAEAFAIGKMLVANGVVTPREWFDVISDEIRKAVEAGDPDRGDTYYQHWLNALERICIEKGLFDAPTLAENRRLWALAVKNTPHGHPIEFKYAFVEGEHEHTHEESQVAPEPMAVFAADEREAPPTAAPIQ